MKTEQSPAWFRPQQQLPDVNERVIVVCDGYRCLGFVDTEGVWRQDKDQAPIKVVTGWGRLED